MTCPDSTAPDTRRVTVTRGRHGWEILEEQEGRVIRRVRVTDWHRVERAMGIHRGRPVNVVLESRPAAEETP